MSLNLLITPEQILYEEKLLQNNDNETLWLEYFEAYSSDFKKSAFILDRAVSELPASMILWSAYLSLPWSEKDNDILLNLYKRALLALYDTPAIWFKYLEFLSRDKSESGRLRLRQGLDSSLFNLDRPHHGKIWYAYLELAEELDNIDSARIYSRFYEVSDEFFPNGSRINSEQCILKVTEYGDFNTAVELCLDMKTRIKPYSRLHIDFMLEFLRLLVSAPSFENDVFMEDTGISASKDSPKNAKDFLLILSDYYSTRKNCDKARYFYSLAFAAAVSVIDIISVFDAVCNWEENQMEILYVNGRTDELKFRMKLLRRLLDQQSVLIIDVLIKNSPHRIDNWLDRAKIYEMKGDQREVINTYVTAIRRVNPLSASSKNGHSMATIWLEYADIYISQGDLATANVIFSHAIKSQFRTVKDLAEIQIAWTEMIFTISDDDALKHIERVLYIPEEKLGPELGHKRETKSVHEQLSHSGDLWKLYIDILTSMIEENEDNSKIYEKLNIAYSRLLSLQKISLRMLVDYADFSETHESLAKSFAIYEAGIESFKSPQAQFHIWKVYLKKFSTKMHQDDVIRYLFERCLSSEIPGFQALDIYDQYFTFELKREHLVSAVNILRNALSYLTLSYSFPRYTRENRNKIADDKYLLYSKLSSVISQNLQDKVLYRHIMAEALQDTHLTISSVVKLGLEFIDFERSENETQRVRALFRFLVGLAHPDLPVMKNLWTNWETWEVETGTENSFKQLLKARRLIKNEHKSLSDAKSDFNPMGFIIGEHTVVDKEPRVTAENPDAIELDMYM